MEASAAFGGGGHARPDVHLAAEEGIIGFAFAVDPFERDAEAAGGFINGFKGKAFRVTVGVFGVIGESIVETDAEGVFRGRGGRMGGEC